MKAYSNYGNPAALKLIISASFAKKELNLEVVKDENLGSYKSLPVLETPTGTLFSTTQAAKYLFPPNPTHRDEVTLWLDYDSTRIQPCLHSDKIGNVTDPALLKVFNVLEVALKKDYFLCGHAISVADVTIWSSLFPIGTDNELKTIYFASSPNVLKWFIAIYEHDIVKKSMESWSKLIGLNALKAYTSVSWYPHDPEVTISMLEKMQIEEAAENVEPNEIAVGLREIDSAKEAWLNNSKQQTKHSLESPVLPKPGEKNILITSALPYVNNIPHLGNIIGCVLSADVFARYCRLRNWNTLYISGTDEYGTATETKALEEKLTPQEICDKYFKIHKEIYSWFNISFDYFGRTTTELQKKITHEIFMRVYKNGYTSINSVEQLLCVNCDRYLADRFVEGTCPDCKFDDARGDQCDSCGHLINAVELINPRCKVCNNTPVKKSSDQIFLDLPKLEDKLNRWVEKTANGWSLNARNITNAWLKEGLKPRCITRDLKWGIQVPLKGFEKKVFYVWFDAPIGYLSITANYTSEWRKWWQPSADTEVSLYHFMAKDNVPFHSIMFPATLFSVDENYLLVKHIMATEYLNYEDGKFSKSRGLGVFGNDAKETNLPADVFRFYLLHVRPESQDSSFTWSDLAIKHNTELLNNIGNFINRALMFADKFFSAKIPTMNLLEEDYKLLALITREITGYIESIEKGRLKDGIRALLNIGRHSNQYMQIQAPWVLIKGSPEKISRAGTVIGIMCNIACQLMIMLQPYLPDTAEVLSKMLNVSLNQFILDETISMLLPPGHKIQKPSPLFAKIEDKLVESLKSKFSGNQKASNTAPTTNTKSDKKGNKKNVNKSGDRPPSPKKEISKANELESAILRQTCTLRIYEANPTVDAGELQSCQETLKLMLQQLDKMREKEHCDSSVSHTDENDKLDQTDDDIQHRLSIARMAISDQKKVVKNMKNSDKKDVRLDQETAVLAELRNQLSIIENEKKQKSKK